MPESAGKKRVSKSKQKKPTNSDLQGVLGRQKALSRAKALRRMTQILTLDNIICDEVVQLMTFFDFHIDELTEAGVPYEVVRALEKRYPLLLHE